MLLINRFRRFYKLIAISIKHRARTRLISVDIKELTFYRSAPEGLSTHFLFENNLLVSGEFVLFVGIFCFVLFVLEGDEFFAKFIIEERLFHVYDIESVKPTDGYHY